MNKSSIVRPLRWLLRFRHRRGYGIHSPFAFSFVTGVVYEQGTYYAYPELKAMYKQLRPHGVRLKDGRLLFRLANFAQPQVIGLVGYRIDSWAARCLSEGCRHARIVEDDELSQADFVLLSAMKARQAEAILANLPTGGTLVVMHTIGRNREVWRNVIAHPRAVVTFNLADFGIVMVRPELNKQNYVINYY